MRILLTAFEPYDVWLDNSSWMTLVEVLKHRPPDSSLTTRRYPVNLQELARRLDEDLRRGYDCVLHLGQSPGATSIRLEAMAINAAGVTEEAGQELPSIAPERPTAYRATLPLAPIANVLRMEGIPASISYHAGTNLCNAAMYLSLDWIANNHVSAIAGFIHLPLATEQAVKSARQMPSLPVSLMAKGIGSILDYLQEQSPVDSTLSDRYA